MTEKLVIGCCGWSYLRMKDFAKVIGERWSSQLQAYARLFNSVEVNSTFYRIPRLATAERWREEASAGNSRFQFTVKAYRGITHLEKFGGRSAEYFAALRKISDALRATVIVFQSPASFLPTASNIQRAREFFGSAERGEAGFAWEPRGRWYEVPEAIVDLCEECRVVHCVDPFRNLPLSFAGGNIAYFRLHGLGTTSMYNYSFSQAELDKVYSIVRSLPQSLHAVYVFFNNVFAYSNGREFSQMIQSIS